MYENPETMRQLVNDRLDESRSLAAHRRLVGSARRRHGLRARWTNRFSTPRFGRSPKRLPATA